MSTITSNSQTTPTTTPAPSVSATSTPAPVVTPVDHTYPQTGTVQQTLKVQIVALEAVITSVNAILDTVQNELSTLRAKFNA
jgi:hypothetical protein